MNAKILIKKGITVLAVMSMLISSFSGVNVFAEISDMMVYASADFDDVTTVEETHNGMKFQHKPKSGGIKDGAPVIDENPIPYYGAMLKYAQNKPGNLQRMVFTLDEPIAIGANAPENSYAEFSYDLKLENGTTGVLFDFGGSYNLNLNALGNLISNNTITHATITTGTNKVFNNVRIRVDLDAKTVVGIYVNDELVADLSEEPLVCAETTAETFNQFRIYIGKGSVADTLYIDNVNVVTYTSEDGTSPIASKAVLKSVLDKIDVTSLTDVQKSVFDNAVLIAKNPIAIQSEVDGVVEELKAFSDVTPDIPEPPSNEPFTMSENFESPLSESEFDVTYGEGIIESEIYDNTAFGNNTLKIKCDMSKKNVSQFVDFGFGNKKINFADEEANCYVEFGIDFASYNMSKYGKNIFVYFRDSADTNMANLYITGGNTIRISGLVEGEVILDPIKEPSKMKNVRVVMELTDSDGNTSQKIIGIYADNELLSANYPLHMKETKGFAKARVMISNVKDSDFGQEREWSANIDNMTVTKYYSQTGENPLYTAGELVSLMRNVDSKAVQNYEDKVYSEEKFQYAKSAISKAAAVYLNMESTDEDIDSSYRELLLAEKKLDITEGNTFDVSDVVTSAEKTEGSTEISVDLEVVTSQSFTDVISPTFVGLLMKKGDNADEVLDRTVKTLNINSDSNGNLSLNFDLSEYSEDDKQNMYIKLFAFTDISKMELADINLPVLFGNESEVDNELYRYSSEKCAYQIVDGDAISVFTSKGDKDTENTLCVFKSDFDFKDFSDRSLSENLIYINTSKTDKNGKCAFSVRGIPSGEYTYYLNGNKGKFVSSDANCIENALKEVCENPEKIESLRYILGVDEDAYNTMKQNGVKPDEVLEDILKDKTYTVSDIQDFVVDLLETLYMVNNFKSAKTVDFVRETIDTYGNRIRNISEYKSLNNKSKNIAEKYILDHIDEIDSVSGIEDLIDDAVAAARKQNSSQVPGGSGGGGGGGGGSSRPSESVMILQNSVSDKKEDGDSMEAHSVEFADLNKFEWAKPAVAFLAKKGSIAGKAEGIFAPEDMVTRGEFVKMLLLTFDYTLEDLKSTFSDVSDDSWYKPYVMTAAKNGIVTGYSEELFGAEDKISRQDATVIIARVLKNLNTGFSEFGEYIPFIDEELIADYAKEAVFGMAKSGIVNGVEGNYFAPEENTTRAEAAKLIYEAYIFMVTEEG